MPDVMDSRGKISDRVILYPSQQFSDFANRHFSNLKQRLSVSVFVRQSVTISKSSNSEPSLKIRISF